MEADPLGEMPAREPPAFSRWRRPFTAGVSRCLPVALAGVLALLLEAPPPALATEGGADVEMSRISGDPAHPRRHFRLRRPARLASKRAAEIYDLVGALLQKGYARSGRPEAREYRSWKRFNSAPYLSVAHGNHYLNNYANRLAEKYGRYEGAGEFPVGAIIAKDSFSMTQVGSIVLGPLFLMEKMPAGFNPAGGDWKYAMIMPNGTYRGATGGPHAERVRYCIGCHLNVERQDYLFFVPPEYRVKTR